MPTANGAFDKVPIPGEYRRLRREPGDRRTQLRHPQGDSGKLGPQPAVPRGAWSSASAISTPPAWTRPRSTAKDCGRSRPGWTASRRSPAPRSLVAVIAQLQAQGLNVGFHLGVEIDDKDTTTMIASFSQGGLGLPERDYYFRKGKNAEEIRAAYVAHIARMFELAGDTPAAAKAAAAAIMAFETKLAKASRTLVDLRDPEKNYNKFPRAALAKLAPGLDWDGYFATIAFPAGRDQAAGSPAGVLHGLRRPARLRAAGGLARLSALASAVRDGQLSEQAVCRGAFRVLRQEALRRHGTAAALEAGAGRGGRGHRRGPGPALRAEGVQPRRQGPRLDHGELHQGSHARAHPRRRLDEPGHQGPGLQEARHHAQQDRLSRQVARLQQARHRPAALRAQRRWPPTPSNSSRELAKLGKPVDRNEWNMTPQTNNAYYEPTLNEMCFPAGILQPPFFDEKADDATNYGAIGATIGPRTDARLRRSGPAIRLRRAT